jgi:hypothetical protein
MTKTPHTAEYFRARRAKIRAARIAAGTFGVSDRWIKPHPGRGGDPDEIPAEVYLRGKVLLAMMRTPPSLWKPEWLQ